MKSKHDTPCWLVAVQVDRYRFFMADADTNFLFFFWLMLVADIDFFYLHLHDENDTMIKTKKRNIYEQYLHINSYIANHVEHLNI